MRMPFLLVLGLTATSVDAQVYGPPAGPPASGRVPTMVDSRGPQPETQRDMADVRERIRDGRREGSLTRRTARGLRRETGMIDTLADRYRQDGMSDAEQRELDTRAAVARDMVNAERMRGRK